MDIYVSVIVKSMRSVILLIKLLCIFIMYACVRVCMYDNGDNNLHRHACIDLILSGMRKRR